MLRQIQIKQIKVSYYEQFGSMYWVKQLHIILRVSIQMRMQQLVINDNKPNKPIVSTYLTLSGKKIMFCIPLARDC